MAKVIKYIQSNQKLHHKQQIKDIFIKSSSLNLDTEDEKRKAFKKWTDYYLDNNPEWIYLTLNDQSDVTSYLMACPQSGNAEELFEDFLSYDLFEDQFGDFPAHLHMNTHPKYRGKGLGSLLISALETDLGAVNVLGFHIITSPQSENVNFYKKAGLDFQLQRPFKDFKLLFMGKKLA
ncbi:MAG: GNAT family N-acetyltransferase [Bdellovibrionales bacterium]